ncbi:hypothetical protein Maq22A_1p38495 (plasmid) [Methylobacterium aquaticum]|uniref:Uncharacterized protein n=1 Tax=Methylobacterium aquaticum TaxID=270351 RepID=A0A1Y0ZCQ8_9HYPH|nr:hypothetical protein Maq22A_1p38495 [Methylobacterium aquaticum]
MPGAASALPRPGRLSCRIAALRPGRMRGPDGRRRGTEDGTTGTPPDAQAPCGLGTVLDLGPCIATVGSVLACRPAGADCGDPPRHAFRWRKPPHGPQGPPYPSSSSVAVAQHFVPMGTGQGITGE